MERLPLLLTSTIQSASEQFRNITFTVHGENDRARISIVFTNQDTNKSKRKSNSTIRRDNKRLRDYNETVSNNSLNMNTMPYNNYIPQLSVGNISAEIHNEMDTENTPNDAPSISEKQSTVTDHRTNIEMFTKDTGVKLPELDNCINRKEADDTCESKQTVINDNKTVIDEECVVEEFINSCDKRSVTNVRKPNICENISESEEPKTLENACCNEEPELIEKIVLKQSKYGEDLLIGKLFDKKLVVYSMERKTFQILVIGDQYYWKYNKVVTEDFLDVRETDLMTKNVKIAMIKMFNFVENGNEL